jgi:hypothetical protein
MPTKLPFTCENCGVTGTVKLDYSISINDPCPSCSGKLSVGTRDQLVLTHNDFFQEIGHISVFFATLDLFVSQVIDELTPYPAPFKENSTLGQKLNILGDFKSEDVINPEMLAHLKTFLPRAKVAAAERNRYIHDQWIFDPKLISQGRIRRNRYSLKTLDSKEMSIQDLTIFRDELGELQKVFAQAIKSWSPLNKNVEENK